MCTEREAQGERNFFNKKSCKHDVWGCLCWVMEWNDLWYVRERAHHENRWEHRTCSSRARSNERFQREEAASLYPIHLIPIIFNMHCVVVDARDLLAHIFTDHLRKLYKQAWWRCVYDVCENCIHVGNLSIARTFATHHTLLLSPLFMPTSRRMR